MGSLGDELSLGSICGSRRGVIMNVVAIEDEHVKKLEEEKRKIESSQLELPLSLQLLNDAILYLKEENKRCSEMNTQPLLKDFISLDKPMSEEIDMQLLKRDELIREKKFQQWRAIDDHISNTKTKNKLGVQRNGEKSSMLLVPKVETGLGLGLTSSSIRRKGIVASSRGFTSNSMPQPPPPPPQQPAFLQQQALRKQRRCWTPELHRRFVDALQQLGGPGVATPKQIREHMQEEGLTNDEVKSHLQKYRLHIRKPNSNSEKQSAVVLGFNLWNSSSQEEEETGEGGQSSKISNSQSDSPQGPLQLPSTTTTTGGDSSMEDVEDAKSESYQVERLRSP
ncbi:PREDICTED: myb family transcription factor EFM-like [Camelina sativa]|uniref:Myb family transcription factor EFM-like n=1 Tax=Camelina sativa TaxID=90675 RepID=A0ABM0VVS2_CAMSA|nr:PREDICTED: myb family transcription factor EFM-like [Camelina sativa]